jgi:hypothetical protein
VDPKLQRLLAELVMMRLFDEFQDALAGIALRLACGAPYADGSAPLLLTTAARSTGGARILYEQHGRPTAKFMKWSKVTYINETTRYVLDANNPLLTVCSANALVISEMQAVRNRIAHKNANSRTAFATVVVRHYGAALNNISPGLLLLSPRFAPTMLERYIASCRVILKHSAKF